MADLRNVSSDPLPEPTFRGQVREMDEAEKQKIRDETNFLNEEVTVDIIKARPNLGQKGERVIMRRKDLNKYERAGYVTLAGGRRG